MPKGVYDRRRRTDEEKLKTKNRVKAYQKQWAKEHPWSSKDLISRLLWNAKKRAMKGGFEFSITKDDITIPEFCPYIDCKLESSQPRGSSRRFVASLDRIDPTKGYTKDNIEVISHIANTMKNNATKEQLLSFANEIIRRYGS